MSFDRSSLEKVKCTGKSTDPLLIENPEMMSFAFKQMDSVSAMLEFYRQWVKV